MTISLIPPEVLPHLPGLEDPKQFYQVLKKPAPLAGMVRPNAEWPWAAIAKAGFQRVVCLFSESPNYNLAPLTILRAVDLEELCHE